MARPNSYRRVGNTAKRCETCKHFLQRNQWCKRWSFSATEEYVCTKWVKGIGEADSESPLKEEYRKAVGEKKIINREENYAVEYTPKIKSEHIEQGWLYRYFAKQGSNPYGNIVEISQKSYQSRGSTTSGLDGSYYEVIETFVKKMRTYNIICRTFQQLMANDFNVFLNLRYLILSLYHTSKIFFLYLVKRHFLQRQSF